MFTPEFASGVFCRKILFHIERKSEGGFEMNKFLFFTTLSFFLAENILTATVHAEIKTYTGVGEYIIDSKTSLEAGYQNAELYAKRNVIEQAGVFVASYVKIANNQLKKDEITTFAAGIVKNISVAKRETTPLPEGYKKIRVTITAKVDTNNVTTALYEWKTKTETEIANLVEQNNYSQRVIYNLQQRIAQLENDLLNSKAENQTVEIQREMSSINRDTTYFRKIDEAWRHFDNKDFEGAVFFFNLAMSTNSNDYRAYYGRGSSYAELKNYSEAMND